MTKFVIVEYVHFNDYPEVSSVCTNKNDAIVALESMMEDIINECKDNFDEEWNDCSFEEYAEENYEYDKENMIFYFDDEEGGGFLKIVEVKAEDNFIYIESESDSDVITFKDKETAMKYLIDNKEEDTENFSSEVDFEEMRGFDENDIYYTICEI